MPEETPISKHNQIIQAKIQTRQEEADSIGHWGPGLLVVLGFIICFIFLSILWTIIGIFFIILGIWWSSKREKQKKRLLNEIRELEVELD